MKENRGNISSKQMLTFMLSAQIGVGILSLPSDLAKEMGHDGWIAVVLSGVLTSIIIVILVKFLRRYNNKSILQINEYLYGKTIGLIINFFFAVYLLATSAVVLRRFADVVRLIVLRLTPPLVLSLFMLIPTVYLVWYGLKPICRFANTLYVILFITSVILALVYKNIRTSFLMPVGQVDMGLILKGMYIASYSYLGIEVITIIYPKVMDKNKIMSSAVAGNMITCIFYTVVVAMTTALFGENLLRSLELPIYSLVQTYRDPIVERIDLFFIALWFPVMGNAMRTYFFCSYVSMCQIFGIKKKGGFYAAFIVVLIIFSRIPKDYLDVIRYGSYSNMAGIAVVTFFILSYLFSFINRRGVVDK
ncbi:MAG: GerAB/ArcD/ProY family transporter [Bacillota bacterium]|nr:GerAB/ArcD/ProY family transporter [Bacillota bacterium]